MVASGVAVRSFHSRRARRIARGDPQAMPPSRADRARLLRLLARLEQARSPHDLDLPGAMLHRLAGDRKGYWSVKVSRRLRLVFRFEGGHARDVDVVDYHRS